MDKQYAEEEKATLTRDRLFEVVMHQQLNGGRETYYVVGYSAIDAVASLVEKLTSLPQPVGWNIKEYFFTAESS
jgi:hypothetical protein